MLKHFLFKQTVFWDFWESWKKIVFLCFKMYITLMSMWTEFNSKNIELKKHFSLIGSRAFVVASVIVSLLYNFYVWEGNKNIDFFESVFCKYWLRCFVNCWWPLKCSLCFLNYCLLPKEVLLSKLHIQGTVAYEKFIFMWQPISYS